MSYVGDSSASAVPFDFKAIPKISKEQSHQDSLRSSTLLRRSESSTDVLPSVGARSEAVAAVATTSDLTKNGDASGSRAKKGGETQSSYAQQLAEVPDLASYGPVLSSSSKPVELTESETEYVVACVKHIFAEHIVFQVRPFPSSA